MKSHNLLIGCWGEEIAKDYLKNKGYKIISQNHKTRYVEIDLIVRQRKTLVFVEVRTKSNSRFGTPEETLKRKKINKLIRGAIVYATQNDYYGFYRIDAICILLDKNKNLIRISHYQNITP